MRKQQKLITLEEALARTLRPARPLPTESVSLEQALGRVLRRDARSPIAIPSFDKAAIDGFAVRCADVAGASRSKPVVLAIGEDLPAGRTARVRLAPGTAARIMTGAPMPRGADAVVMQEDTRRKGQRVLVFRAVAPGASCAAAGEDVSRGRLVVAKGTPARARGARHAGGDRTPPSACHAAPATRRPFHGYGLVRPGTRLGAGKIYDANGYSLVSLARRCGSEAPLSRDRRRSARRPGGQARPRGRLRPAPALGRRQRGRLRPRPAPALEAPLPRGLLGSCDQAWGRPVFLGRKGRQAVFALPGNPVSCIVVFELLVRPYLDTLLGRRQIGLVPLRAKLVGELTARPGRRQFLRARLEATGGSLRVRPFSNQRAGVLRSLTESNALIDLPGNVSHVPAGRTVRVLALGPPFSGT